MDVIEEKVEDFVQELKNTKAENSKLRSQEQE